MHGNIVLFANNAEKEAGIYPGAEEMLFTADQMRAYGEACWKDAYKHAAGWLVVPVEPTEDMKCAAVKHLHGNGVHYVQMYKAMLAAAPKAAPLLKPSEIVC